MREGELGCGFNLKDTLVILGMCMGLYRLIGWSVSALLFSNVTLRDAEDVRETENLIAAMIFLQGTATYTALGFLTRWRQRGSTPRQWLTTSARAVGFSALIGSVYGVAYFQYAIWANDGLPHGWRFEGLTGSPEVWIVFCHLLFASLIGPVVEEFFFRGALISGLRTHLGWPSSIIVSSVLFVSWHPAAISELFLIPPILLGGLITGLLYCHTRSLIPPIVAHGVSNSIITILSYAI